MTIRTTIDRDDKKDAERYRWLCENVVFLHKGVGERDPVKGAEYEWNINGDWPGYQEQAWYKSLDEAIDKAMGAVIDGGSRG